MKKIKYEWNVKNNLVLKKAAYPVSDQTDKPDIQYPVVGQTDKPDQYPVFTVSGVRPDRILTTFPKYKLMVYKATVSPTVGPQFFLKK